MAVVHIAFPAIGDSSVACFVFVPLSSLPTFFEFLGYMFVKRDTRKASEILTEEADLEEVKFARRCVRGLAGGLAAWSAPCLPGPTTRPLFLPRQASGVQGKLGGAAQAPAW